MIESPPVDDNNEAYTMQELFNRLQKCAVGFYIDEGIKIILHSSLKDSYNSNFAELKKKGSLLERIKLKRK